MTQVSAILEAHRDAATHFRMRQSPSASRQTETCVMIGPIRSAICTAIALKDTIAVSHTMTARHRCVSAIQIPETQADVRRTAEWV